MRLIQETHPDIEFDWPQILKGRPDAALERSRPEPGGRGERSARAIEKPDRRERTGRGGRPVDRPVAERRVAPPPAAAAPPEVPALEPPGEATGPAHERLGSAGLARLRARFAELSSRIRDRTDDEVRRQELKAVAERLNPDGWRTDEEVSAGLESYEATFEAVKTAIGGRPKTAGQTATPVPEPPLPDQTQ